MIDLDTSTALAVGAAAIAATLHCRHRSVLKSARRRLLAAMPGVHPAGSETLLSSGFDSCIGLACDRLGQLEHRLKQRHPVTGLATREVLLDVLGTNVHQPRILGVVTLSDFDALAAFDADAADLALATVGRRLHRMMPSGRLVAHVDRASFAILFDTDSLEEVRKELQAVDYALSGRVSIPGVEYMPLIVHGQVRVPSDDVKPTSILARALASVHGSDLGTRNSPFISTDDGFALEQDLRQAVERHELELWYQPVIDVRAGRLCSVEALVRWRHPGRGLVPPTQFIPAMESLGLSEEIGNWVLDRAMRDAAAWARDGLDNVKVAVNLSAHQLVRPDFALMVERLIARHGLAPQMLELELTETAAAVDAEAARMLFAKLRTLGITIVIDDFGAGYASLSYLKRLEFDKLKIDREFVTNVDTDRQAQAICQSIITLAQGLGLTVLGEGVERREEVSWLRAQGCHLFQGYHFAKPLPYDQLLAFAATSGALVEKCAPDAAGRRQLLGALAA